MLIGDIINHLDNKKRQTLGEIIRFGIVGLTATAIQYGIYLLSLLWMGITLANAVGYLVSFIFNYIASTYFTFHVKSTARHGVGFIIAHIINFSLQTICLNGFCALGMDKRWALLPTLCICVPINFVLVRYFLKKK